MNRAPRVNKDERRSQIIEIAIREFGNLGYRQTSMELIALGAGISKPILYQFFDSKEDLYIAVIHQLSEKLVIGIKNTNSNGANTYERVKNGVSMFFALIRENQNLVKLFFGTDYVSDRVCEQIQISMDLTAQAAAETVLQRRELKQGAAILIGKIIVASVMAAAKHTDFEDYEQYQTTLETTASIISRGIEAFPFNQSQA